MSIINRRDFVQLGAMAATGSKLESAQSKSDRVRTNILFIGVDDLNVSLGSYGNSVVKTPNLDALAARGTRFEKAYCQYPLCGPSRASLMTGRSPDKTRITGNAGNFTRIRDTMPDVVTLGQLFRKNGYYSARVGKIFHADNPADIGKDGLDDPATWDYVYDPAGVDHLKDEPLITNFTPGMAVRGKDGTLRLGTTISFYEAPSADREITDSIGADEVIRLLTENRHRPFFIAFGLYRPHVPWIVPKPYFDMYPLEEIHPRPFSEAELQEAPPIAYTTRPPNYGMSEMECRQAIRAYYASTSFMDAQVGRVLSELKRLGLDKNTVVVFWADHGWSLGEHGQWQKRLLFESSAQVPLLFAGPGVTGGQVCHRTVEHLDVYPTLADVCGLHNAPEALDGASLRSLLRNAHAAWNRPAISQVLRESAKFGNSIGYSIRSERYRYTSWQGAATGEELYDYEVDPRETKNMVKAPEMLAIKEDLRKQLEMVTKNRGRTIPLGAQVHMDSTTRPIGEPSS